MWGGRIGGRKQKKQDKDGGSKELKEGERKGEEKIRGRKEEREGERIRRRGGKRNRGREEK